MVTSRYSHRHPTTRCYLALVVSLATLWSLTGCVQPADRVLVDQSIGAAVHIQQQENASPVVVSAAKDIELNLRTAQRGVGLPQQSQPYDPKVSERARKESVEQHETVDSISAWVTGLVKDNLPMGGAIVTTLTAAWLFLKRRLADKKNFAL